MTTKTLTCVIVDDETANLEMLSNYVEQIPYLILKATFDKPIEALTYLLKNSTDVLITDICMPRLSGIELYESISKNGLTQVIFISGFADKIVDALEHSVADYLHKPVSFVRFEKATQKAFFFVNKSGGKYEDLPIEILEIALESYPNLSETEKKILKLISEGNSTQKMAELLFTSVRTAENHRYSIRKKFKLFPNNSLTQIAKFIVEKLEL